MKNGIIYTLLTLLFAAIGIGGSINTICLFTHSITTHNIYPETVLFSILAIWSGYLAISELFDGLPTSELNEFDASNLVQVDSPIV